MLQTPPELSGGFCVFILLVSHAAERHRGAPAATVYAGAGQRHSEGAGTVMRSRRRFILNKKEKMLVVRKIIAKKS